MRFLLLFSCILIFRSQADVRRKVGKSGGANRYPRAFERDGFVSIRASFYYV